jgi:hypothetical protein
MRLALITTLCIAFAVPPAAAAELDAEMVRQAIDRAVGYLKREQHDNGSWDDIPGFPGGISALATLALLNAGVPPSDPSVQKALNFLRKQQPSKTYSTALQTMVFCLAEPKANLPLIKKNADWLEKTQKNIGRMKGAWAYPEADGDNSNSQFALLALYEAERVGIQVNMRTWQLAHDYWRDSQNPDGSWSYKPGLPNPTGSMTSAGIAAMIITSDRLSKGDAEVNGDRVNCCGQQEANTEIARGLAWMGRNFSVHSNPGAHGAQGWLLYYLYGIERVGRLTNRRFLGEHDWYREGASLLVSTQDKLSGFWTGTGVVEEQPQVGTSLALLFLAKGRRPVLAAKLKHEPLDDWNHHRNDLANLTTFVETRWQRDLTWQVIDAQAAGADDLLEAPVLFISGKLRPEISDEQVRRLREYVNRGGFLFAESCCDDDGFDAGFRNLMERMFPEPDYKLRLLEESHPAYSAEERVEPVFLRDPRFKGLYGIDVGCRTSVIYSPGNLSCYWELARPGRDRKFSDDVQMRINGAMALGINVMAYATNREVRYKLDQREHLLDADLPSDPFERVKLYVAKIKHDGAWNSAPRALNNLLRVFSVETGLRVSTDEHEMTLADRQLTGYQLAFLHGRSAFHLSEAERKQLKTYVERGGVVFGDAVCGNEEFAKSFRREMQAVFGAEAWGEIPSAHAMYTTAFDGFDVRTVGRRDPRRSGDGPLKSAVKQAAPELEGVKLGERWGVIFSRYDLSCALEKHESLECPGYTREDAARLGLNILLYALHQDH